MIARSNGFEGFFTECPLYPAGTAPSRRLAADRNLQTAVKKDFRKKKGTFFPLRRLIPQKPNLTGEKSLGCRSRKTGKRTVGRKPRDRRSDEGITRASQNSTVGFRVRSKRQSAGSLPTRVTSKKSGKMLPCRRRPRSVQFAIPECVGGWLRTIARRLAIQRSIQRNRQHLIDPQTTTGIPATGAETPLDQLIEKERCEALHAALCHLKLPYRQVLKWFYFENCSLEQISKMEQIPVGTVKSRLHTARKILSARLQHLRTA